MKKQILKTTLLFVFMFLFSVLTKAQDSLVVYDVIGSVGPTPVAASPVLPPNTPGAAPAVVTSVVPTQFNLLCVFRISDPSFTNKVYIKIGTAPDAGELKNETLTKVMHTGVNYLQRGGTDVCSFKDKAVAYQITINQNDLVNAKWITVYTKDNSGNYSLKKYFKIQ